MDVKKLFKQTCVFERHSLKLDTHNDSLSEIDWRKLSEVLAKSEPTVGSISARFQIKLADDKSKILTDFTHQMESVPAEADIKKQLTQMLTEWLANNPDCTYDEALEEATQLGARLTTPGINPLTGGPDRRTEFQKSRGLDENGDRLPSSQEQEFVQQDKDIQQFMDKEKEDKAAQQRSIQGKTPFSVQDAAAIINSELNEIKTYVQQVLKRKLIGDQKLMFIFYPNGNVGTVGQDIPMVNAIRRGFAIPLQLASRSFCTMHKKYFTGEIKYEMSL